MGLSMLSWISGEDIRSFFIEKYKVKNSFKLRKSKKIILGIAICGKIWHNIMRVLYP